MAPTTRSSRQRTADDDCADLLNIPGTNPKPHKEDGFINHTKGLSKFTKAQSLEPESQSQDDEEQFRAQEEVGSSSHGALDVQEGEEPGPSNQARNTSTATDIGGNINVDGNKAAEDNSTSKSKGKQLPDPRKSLRSFKGKEVIQGNQSSAAGSPEKRKKDLFVMSSESEGEDLNKNKRQKTIDVGASTPRKRGRPPKTPAMATHDPKRSGVNAVGETSAPYVAAGASDDDEDADDELPPPSRIRQPAPILTQPDLSPEEEVSGISTIERQPSPIKPNPPPPKDRKGYRPKPKPPIGGTQSNSSASASSSANVAGPSTGPSGRIQASTEAEGQAAVEEGEPTNDGDQSNEDESDDQDFASWNSFTHPSLNFQLNKMRDAVKRLGRQPGGRKISKNLKVTTSFGKEIEESFESLEELYTKLGQARLQDNRSPDDDVKIFSDIDQGLESLASITERISPFFSEESLVNRKRLLKELYFILFPLIVRDVLKQVFLADAVPVPVPKEALDHAVRLIKIVIDATDAILKQKEEIQSQNCGQTKRPLKSLRDTLRSVMEDFETHLDLRREAAQKARRTEEEKRRRQARVAQEREKRIEDEKQRKMDEANRKKKLAETLNNVDPITKQEVKARMEFRERNRLKREAEAAKAKAIRRELDREASGLHNSQIGSVGTPINLTDDPFDDNYVVPAAPRPSSSNSNVFSRFKKTSPRSEAPGSSQRPSTSGSARRLQVRQPSPELGASVGGGNAPYDNEDRIDDEDEDDDDSSVEANSDPNNSISSVETSSRLQQPSKSLSRTPHPEEQGEEQGEDTEDTEYSEKEISLSDLSEAELERLIICMKQKYILKKQGKEYNGVWETLRRKLRGGTCSEVEIWGYAEELQRFYNGEHDAGREMGEKWSYEIWGGEKEDEEDGDESESEGSG